MAEVLAAPVEAVDTPDDAPAGWAHAWALVAYAGMAGSFVAVVEVGEERQVVVWEVGHVVVEVGREAQVVVEKLARRQSRARRCQRDP